MWPLTTATDKFFFQRVVLASFLVRSFWQGLCIKCFSMMCACMCIVSLRVFLFVFAHVYRMLFQLGYSLSALQFEKGFCHILGCRKATLLFETNPPLCKSPKEQVTEHCRRRKEWSRMLLQDKPSEYPIAERAMPCLCSHSVVWSQLCVPACLVPGRVLRFRAFTSVWIQGWGGGEVEREGGGVNWVYPYVLKTQNPGW